ncbi:MULTISPECIES: radical SAM protein [unclassified Mycobacterium]|uniref:radical SAM/SPASM domain-containing protein n=1 Tax=unclassified Mycobacterium TaxID=2642494 RepID=UPI000993B1EC|nr:MULTISPECIES: radical SAM protein [unclassified Mycobacterium]
MTTTFAWLEITGKCQLECAHCYADSGPAGTHGQMGTADWVRVIDELANAGLTMVQFIGGEPMLHPSLGTLIERALDHGLNVEVYSNLVHVPAHIWSLLEREGVSLATSYYSDNPQEHNDITGRNSHARTRANIEEAVRRGIPLRAGVVQVNGGQNAAGAVTELKMLGVKDASTDENRGVGRGRIPDVSQLCGNCASGVVAISPTGEVWPCVFSRWLPIGNVLDETIERILASAEAEQTRADLEREFAGRTVACSPCLPDTDDCNPRRVYCDPCGPNCKPSHGGRGHA